MVLELWKKISVFCGNHDDLPVEQLPLLEPHDVNGRGLIYYNCPLCKNRVGMPDYEKMVNYIDNKLTSNQASSVVEDLTNHRWKVSKGIRYKILNHDTFDDTIKVSMYDSKEANRKI